MKSLRSYEESIFRPIGTLSIELISVQLAKSLEMAADMVEWEHRALADELAHFAGQWGWSAE